MSGPAASEPGSLSTGPTGGPRPPRRIPGSGGGYQIITDPAVFPGTAAAVIARRIAALSEQDTITVALSGGRTPAPVYRELADHADLDWEQLEVFFADERVVPFDDPASNYGMARRTLLDRVPVPNHRIHPLPAGAPDPEAALAAYAEAMPERFDIIILGIGEDGHTASLFPGSETLLSTRRVERSRAPEPPHERLTITAPVIQSARLLVVLATGASKSRAVRAALAETGDIAACPARLARRGIWVLGRNVVLPGDGRR